MISSNLAFQRLGRRPPLLLTCAALASWIICFSIGAMVNSARFRYPLSLGQDFWINIVPAILTFIPTNAAILSALSGLLGGCASNLTQLYHGYTKEEAETLSPGPERNDALRRKRFMGEHPVISMLRGFIIYLVYLAGVQLATGTDFFVGTQPGDHETAIQGTLSYVRFAGLVSVIAFAIGYDPTRFESLLKNIPGVGGNEVKAADENTPENDTRENKKSKGEPRGSRSPKKPSPQ